MSLSKISSPSTRILNTPLSPVTSATERSFCPNSVRIARCVLIACSRCPQGTQYSTSTSVVMVPPLPAVHRIDAQLAVPRDGIEVGVVVQQLGAFADHWDSNEAI